MLRKAKQQNNNKKTAVVCFSLTQKEPVVKLFFSNIFICNITYRTYKTKLYENILPNIELLSTPTYSPKITSKNYFNLGVKYSTSWISLNGYT